MENKVKKFRDSKEHIFDFGNEFLVVCPKCSQMAKIKMLNEDADVRYSSRKLVCTNCGLIKFFTGKNVVGYVASNKIKRDAAILRVDNTVMKFLTVGGNFDWYFLEPLWLQTKCCGETLWVYNEKHLDFIEKYVAAKLRERIPYKNNSVASRLPKWIKSAKNRENILRAIEKLKGKLDAGH